ncbi:MAG: hypothetical protein ACJ72N_08025 [Labedaea sp.]
MSGRTLVRHAAAGLAATATATALAFVAAGSASAAPPGVVCLTNKFTIVRTSPDVSPNNHLYGLPEGSGFRLTGAEWFNGYNWYQGHGDGHSDGWVPQSDLNCPF